MKSEWNTSAIANICKVVTDGSHTSPKSVSHGKYMVSVKDFTPYGFDFNGCRQISFADYEKLKSSGCVPQKGDILNLWQVLHCRSLHIQAALVPFQ